jgi:hypothetical protein
VNTACIHALMWHGVLFWCTQQWWTAALGSAKQAAFIDSTSLVSFNNLAVS